MRAAARRWPQAADTFGTMMILSSVCLPDFETVARVGSAPKMFQLYLMGDRGWMDDHIERAIAAGYAGFCLTVDTAVYSRRERDISKVLRSGVRTSGRQRRLRASGRDDVGHGRAHQGQVRVFRCG